MSAPVYALLKRPDELFVVEHAHLQPRFVEDSVRFALAGALERYPSSATTTSCWRARSTSRRSTTTTSLAERYGTVGELRAASSTRASRLDAAHRRSRLAQRLNIAASCTRGSLCANSRLMFSRCRKTDRRRRRAKVTIRTGQDSASANANTGSESAAAIDATDT